MTFRMSSPNGELLDALSQAAGASAESSAEAIFETLPNDTNFTPVQPSGPAQLRHGHRGGRCVLPQPTRRPGPSGRRLPPADG
jgi:hypothetical protein